MEIVTYTLLPGIFRKIAAQMSLIASLKAPTGYNAYNYKNNIASNWPLTETSITCIRTGR